MSWIYLFLAIACEIIGTTCLKLTNGFTEKLYIIGAAVGYPLAFVFFGLSLKTIEVSVAYAVWSGVGIAGTSILGSVLFRESMNPTKAFFMGLIFLGLIGINLNKS